MSDSSLRRSHKGTVENRFSPKSRRCNISTTAFALITCDAASNCTFGVAACRKAKGAVDCEGYFGSLIRKHAC